VRVISNLKCGFFLFFLKNRQNLMNLMVFSIKKPLKSAFLENFQSL